jgi:hypothetical protein
MKNLFGVLAGLSLLIICFQSVSAQQDSLKSLKTIQIPDAKISIEQTFLDSTNVNDNEHNYCTMQKDELKQVKTDFLEKFKFHLEKTGFSVIDGIDADGIFVAEIKVQKNCSRNNNLIESVAAGNEYSLIIRASLINRVGVKMWQTSKFPSNFDGGLIGNGWKAIDRKAKKLAQNIRKAQEKAK